MCASFSRTCGKNRLKKVKIQLMTQPLHTISNTTNVQAFGSTGLTSATPSTGGWSSLSPSKTASFSTIQQEVIQTVTYSPGHTYQAYNPVEATALSLYTEQPHGPRRARGEQQEGEATGEVPVGDMFIPMLLIALGYVIVKLFRNRKTSQTL